MVSVRQEHRYQKLVIEQGNVITDIAREIEAATMVRKPRVAVTLPEPSATRRQCRSWMRRNAQDFECATSLAEAANAVLDLPHGAMDDDGHWVWEEAANALDWAENQPTKNGG